MEHLYENFLETLTNETLSEKFLRMRMEFEKVSIPWFHLEVPEVCVRCLGRMKWWSAKG